MDHREKLQSLGLNGIIAVSPQSVSKGFSAVFGESYDLWLQKQRRIGKTRLYGGEGGIRTHGRG